MLVKAIDVYRYSSACPIFSDLEPTMLGKPKPQCDRGSLLSRHTPQYDEYDVSMREVSLIDLFGAKCRMIVLSKLIMSRPFHWFHRSLLLCTSTYFNCVSLCGTLQMCPSTVDCAVISEYVKINFHEHQKKHMLVWRLTQLKW